MILLVIPGAPRTKKNHGRVIQRGRRKFHVPSAAHERWYAEAIVSVAEWRIKNGHPDPINVPVNVRALFYREADTGDPVGYYQALADLLERGRVIVNDKLIASWDGTRLLKDKDRPRIEVEIAPATIESGVKL